MIPCASSRNCLPHPPDDLQLPDCYFVFTDACVIFDHVRHRILLVVNAHVDGDPDTAYRRAVEKIDDLIAQLQAPEVRPLGLVPHGTGHQAEVRSNFTPDGFMQAVEKAKQYIYDGDVIQVVLSQRLSRKLSPALCEQPFNLYRALRYLNPSPYMYYLSYGDVKIIGSSPERLVSEEEHTVVTRPIAGTRKRGATRRTKMRLWRQNCSRTPRSARNISCWWTWGATIWAASATSAASVSTS